MRIIEGALTSELQSYIGSQTADKAPPYEVRTYRALMSQIAKLAYLNKDHLLFFRGQSQDYMNRVGASSFYPNIYRDDYLTSQEVYYRFEVLNQASKLLVEELETKNIEGYKETKRKRLIQWSILQHYEVCRTPLLDFTHSVRVACSFAQHNNKNNFAYVYVFGMPYLTNRISINSEHDLVNIRLLSICPPDALRPYYQDGYLIGTEDITTDYESKTELDFKNRLIAKFRIPSTSKFWGSGFSSIPESVLYPKGDRIEKLCRELQISIENELQPGEMGKFLKDWSGLEEQLQKMADRYSKRRLTIRESITKLSKSGALTKDQFYRLDALRKFRNQLVHDYRTIGPGEVQKNLDRLRDVIRTIS